MWAECLEKSKYVSLRRETNLNRPRWAEWHPYGSRRREWVEEYTVFSTKAFFFFWTILTMLPLVRTQNLDLPKKSQGLKNSSGFPSHFLQEFNLLSLGASISCWEASGPGICLSAQSLFSDALIEFCLVWTCLGLWRPFVKVTQWLPCSQWAQNPEPRPRIVPEILAYLRTR